MTHTAEPAASRESPITMTDMMQPSVDVEQLSLRDYAEKAYLDYSMYVILDPCRTLVMA